MQLRDDEIDTVSLTRVRRSGYRRDEGRPRFATYTVPPGSHWIAVRRGWSDGPRANDCSETREKLKTLIGPTARVELTVPAVDAKACNAAKRALTKQKQAVKKLQKRVKRASGAKKRQLKAKLKKAKTKRTKLAARVQRDC